MYPASFGSAGLQACHRRPGLRPSMHVYPKACAGDGIIYNCGRGLLYKAFPMVASIDSQVLLKLRPYPMRWQWLL
jgi:hypothetical protein